jgi:GH25 family lysozyme M1 (1,4-beta-N-acetylmuramidase)
MKASTLTALFAMLGCGCATAGDDDDSEAQALQIPPFFGGDPANHALFAVDVSVWETPIAQSQMDCFWEAGVRHVIVGTQEPLVARQQLAMAVSRGMTVDAYVYLYWDVDIATQVDAAFAMVQGFPTGRMWLDIEQDLHGLGSNAVIAMIQKGLATCEAKTPGRCGIYTGPGWWKTYLANTTMFASEPLWYAQYNKKRSLSDWATEHFGGWSSPVAKQFQTAPLCAIGGADWNVMQVTTTPTVIVDRSLPPDDHMPPIAPANLFPEAGMVVPIDYVKIMSGTVPRASSYQLALERYTGTSWASYYTWTTANAYVKVSPPTTPALYRLRARAENVHGWGEWSDYTMFDYGKYTGPRPSGTPPPPPPPPPDDVPGSLSPDGATITTASVVLSASSVTNATSYQFEIESNIAGTWTSYYTYTTASPTKTLYPQTRGRNYRFRVRAMVGGTSGAWSNHATFYVQ